VEVARSRLNIFLTYVLRRTAWLSLHVAAEKTEAVLFRGKRRTNFADPFVRVDNVLVPVKPKMKYLGVMIDCRLNFKHHFSYIGAKVGGITKALGRLLPNLRGPHEGKRRLYANIITSIVMYAAPIWAPALATSSELRNQCRRWQRAIVLRTCAAYRSVSWDSATLLSRLIPFELLAMERARTYWRWQDAKEAEEATPEVLNEIKIGERTITQRQWVLLLSRPGAAGVRLQDALLPHIELWMTRSWGGLTFRITQLLTGHGCFGTFLSRIKRLDDATCPFCGLCDDSPDHTIAECTEWFDERCSLMGAIGPDLLLSNIIREICSNRGAWLAFSKFAEDVMRRKEDAERIRQNMAFDPE